MVDVHPSYVVDENQNRQSVILSIDEWSHILDELEELDDIRAYDLAKSDNAESVPFEQAIEDIRKSPVQ